MVVQKQQSLIQNYYYYYYFIIKVTFCYEITKITVELGKYKKIKSSKKMWE